MKLGDYLKKFKMDSLKIKTPYLEAEFKLNDSDKKAAWELYIELLTRITTQPLPHSDGDEKTALDSIFSIFPLTRSILKKNGHSCIEFTKIAIVVLNQVVRPFTAKWHKLSIENVFDNDNKCREFREELIKLQGQLSIYSKMLADMVGVEDLTNLEENDDVK